MLITQRHALRRLGHRCRFAPTGKHERRGVCKHGKVDLCRRDSLLSSLFHMFLFVFRAAHPRRGTKGFAKNDGGTVIRSKARMKGRNA